MVYRQPLPTRAAARQAVFEYIEVFYNRQRLHSALGCRLQSLGYHDAGGLLLTTVHALAGFALASGLSSFASLNNAVPSSMVAASADAGSRGMLLGVYRFVGVDDDSFSWKGWRVQLTPVEVTLLQRLFRLEGTTVGRAELTRIAGVSTAGGRALDAHVHRLRGKLGIPGVDLATERQRGFRLELS